MSRPQAARTSTRLGCVSPGARSGRRLTRSRRRDLPAERMAALKTATSHRSVPLWPQLREALERYMAERPPSRLLFPSYRTGEEAMLTDFRKLLDVVAVRAGWKPGEIRSKMFRHTHCAARLQTAVDQGAPVTTYTVAREMGHGGEAMVRKVYGHLGQVRHRAEAMEYRVEQHAAKLGARLEALRGWGLAPPLAPRLRPLDQR